MASRLAGDEAGNNVKDGEVYEHNMKDGEVYVDNMKDEEVNEENGEEGDLEENMTARNSDQDCGRMDKLQKSAFTKK